MPEQLSVTVSATLFAMPETAASGYTAKDIADNTAKTADSTGRGQKTPKRAADALDSTADDLAFLREAAEREAVNKYTTATVHIDVGGVTAIPAVMILMAYCCG